MTNSGRLDSKIEITSEILMESILSAINNPSLPKGERRKSVHPPLRSQHSGWLRTLAFSFLPSFQPSEVRDFGDFRRARDSMLGFQLRYEHPAHHCAKYSRLLDFSASVLFTTHPTTEYASNLYHRIQKRRRLQHQCEKPASKRLVLRRIRHIVQGVHKHSDQL